MDGNLVPRLQNGCTQDYIEITNVADEKVKFRDTLHHRRVADQPCVENVCKGSLYQPTVLSAAHQTSKKELLTEATDFIGQYYSSFKDKDPLCHKNRLYDVMKCINTTGTYDFTEDELIFGVKTAWRNASRCIGRIQWENLHVFDCRKVNTTKDMFTALCNHIEYATNGGNIRATISVFPHLDSPTNILHLWSPQLIKYAGYRNDDGSITGDPSSVEFTDICLRMGWSGKRTEFDVLPLVLQVNDENPEYFDVPPHLVLEVSLKHPKYAWFENLGLKWYGVPAVSNMALDCGGLKFATIPFNGWYMSSEIGRDLCDSNRYNKTKEIAELMGLDTSTKSTLWIDQAVIAVNVATLYSFQQERVTITEHHSAADSFLTFMQREYEIRGGCPADWVWINPPLSASNTPVFHQEMLNYKLKPSYEYQEEPWKRHTRKVSTAVKCPLRKGLWKCSKAAVLLSLRLMSDARARRIPCTVLYATETGRSERFATQLWEIFDSVFRATLVRMDKYDITRLCSEKLLLIVTSTFGDGNPPRNGAHFIECLDHMLELRDTSTEEGISFSHIKFAVFGLGSRAYPKFCAAAHSLDNTLHDLGMKQFHPLGEGDQMYGQESSFYKWARCGFQVACSKMKGQFEDNLTIIPQVRLITRSTSVPEANDDDVCSALSKLHSVDIVQLKVTAIKNLQSPHSGRRTNLVQLSNDVVTNGRQVVFQPGDHVGVFPRNDAAMVERVIDRVLFDQLDPDEVVTVEIMKEKIWRHEHRLPPTSIRMALTYFLDITTPPDQMFLEALASLATDDAEKCKLSDLSNDFEKFQEWSNECYTPLDAFLEEFSSVKIPAAFLMHHVPLLHPRFYSLSSSPLSNPDQVYLTVGVVEYNAGKEEKGPRRSGLCSTWLEMRNRGDMVPLFHRTVDNFHLPENKDLPILLIGTGTGIAPLMAFLDQRNVERKEVNGDGEKVHGDITLYFGCRSSDHDHIFKSEIKSFVEEGVISEFNLALSCEPGVPKTYVQDLILRNSAKVYRQVVEEECHIYVCGNISMGTQVENTLKHIISQVGKMSPKDADDYIQRMCNSDRYHKDVYGFKVSNRRQAVNVQRCGSVH